MMEHTSLIGKDGKLFYHPQFIKSSLFNELRDDTAWTQNEFKIFGKSYLEPRMTAWYGPSYKYSNIELREEKMPSRIQGIADELSQFCQFEFNSVLLNYYRSGQDSMGWHRDNEKELDSSCIASLSFGGSRVFKVRHKSDRTVHKITLEDCSLLSMIDMQSAWEHSIPKSSVNQEERINLTFRRIINS